MRAAVVAAGCLAIAVGAAAVAQEAVRPGRLAERLETDAIRFNAWLGDVDGSAEVFSRGRTVAMGGASLRGAQFACFTCHGADGGGDDAGAVPRLAGLPAFYLRRQLAHYASGERQNEVMSPIAAALSAQERAAVSVYYAVLPPTWSAARDGPDGDLLQYGARLSAIGSDEALIPACANCHGLYGTGMAPSVPPLAGQPGGYIAKRLREWKAQSAAEHPDDPMIAIAKKMSERDIEAAAAYFELLAPVIAPAFLDGPAAVRGATLSDG